MTCTSGAILGLVFVVYSVVVVAVRRAAWQTIDNERNSQSWFFPITLLVWLAVTAIYAISGLIQREPRLMMTVMLPAFVGAATLASTTVGSRLARGTPLVRTYRISCLPTYDRTGISRSLFAGATADTGDVSWAQL